MLTTAQVAKYSRPIYAVEEASNYLGLPTATLRSWLFGRNFPTLGGTEFWQPLIQPEDTEAGMLSYLNLLEAHVLSATRDRGVKMPKIRLTLDYLRRELNCERPLIQRSFATAGKYVFVKMIEEHEGTDQWIDASKGGQYPLGPILDEYLERIVWDADTDIPLQFFPKNQKESARVVAINPRIASGRPAVKGVLASIIWQRSRAGELPPDLARDYQLQQLEIETAIDYVERARKAA